MPRYRIVTGALSARFAQWTIGLAGCSLPAFLICAILANTWFGSFPHATSKMSFFGKRDLHDSWSEIGSWKVPSTISWGTTNRNVGSGYEYGGKLTSLFNEVGMRIVCVLACPSSKFAAGPVRKVV